MGSQRSLLSTTPVCGRNCDNSSDAAETTVRCLVCFSLVCPMLLPAFLSAICIAGINPSDSEKQIVDTDKGHRRAEATDSSPAGLSDPSVRRLSTNLLGRRKRKRSDFFG
mmetsp:Transcript_5289/g.12775  ORF Transcript_5289/g.12775 Transcript_5289/m.12775 type:complete len:110 (-) Transcript_5289:455-784(-)